ncbi:MAG: peptide deformylase [Ruminococcaceae bacterium]|nr:peptide deformylase [Oscillospiraceae bacterium]
MALRNIVKYGDPVLRKKSRVVEKFDNKLSDLIEDMIQTMNNAEGVGLAAVQVGILKRVVIVDVGEGPIELVNPEIIEESKEKQITPEGCLSLPGQSGNTVRPMTVKVKAQDRNGKWYIHKGTGLKAKAFCHEIDHLDGILYIDKVIPDTEGKK